MGGASPASADERELQALRQRAYGPSPDIQDDPAAVCRLAALEAAHLAATSSESEHQPEPKPEPEPEATPPLIDAAPAPEAAIAGVPAASIADRSLWQRATTSSARRWLLVACAVAAVLAVVYSVTWLVGPHPDATLRPSGIEPNEQIFNMMFAAPLAQVDYSTLHGYESYRGLEPWTGVNASGDRCLMVMERSSANLLGVDCAPGGADAIVDVGAWPFWGDDFADGLPDGSVIRFLLERESVGVTLYEAPG